MPDNKVAVALSNGRYPVIFLLNHVFQKERILEQGASINVSPTFDRTGTKMAFTSSRLGGPQIFMKDLTSGVVSRVSQNGGYNTEANISYDGTLVVYSRMTDFGHRIFVQDLVTGAERQVSFGPGSDEQPSFCADSYFIAFASSRGGSRGIYLTTRHGGDAKLVPTGGGGAAFPRWDVPPQR
jgi:TolB protein